jgi:hypothetical protein
METEEQQSPGAEDRDQVPADLDAPGAPAANMQPADRRGRAGSRAPAGYTNPPAQSPDALGVVSVLPLIGMVHSQDTASRMTQAELDRWHQHGRLFTSLLKIDSFGEVPMITGAQQKLLIWLKNTTAVLVVYRATSLEHEDIILQNLTDAILQPAKLTWEAAVESAMLEQPLTGARRGVVGG